MWTSYACLPTDHHNNGPIVSFRDLKVKFNKCLFHDVANFFFTLYTIHIFIPPGLQKFGNWALKNWQKKWLCSMTSVFNFEKIWPLIIYSVYWREAKAYFYQYVKYFLDLAMQEEVFIDARPRWENKKKFKLVFCNILTCVILKYFEWYNL